MADQQAKDEAAKNRIISHMNTDHHDSIVRYLEHFCKIPSWTADSGKMTDIDLRSMTFSCGGGRKTYSITLNPPMTSYRDARERAVQLDQQALAGLGRSDITVKEFVPPTGWYAVEFAIISATFLAYSQRWWFAQDAIVHQFLGSGFAAFSWAIQPYLFLGMVGIHSAEMAYFVHYRLQKHSINPRSFLFWQWMSTTFIEGMFSFRRFDALVARKREEKEKQKH
ncbi:hypothetical protein KC331_g15208 [Hortaea werneckii]|uniref:DUF2470 domain-containing protein n=1 Tax=Hortaea werneckii TaxID=91943 RepID=A0A3M7CAH7_HORWE|nr:hypothetical protein KC331_g15208 [Hortaea werneckii]KAI7695827.1 hypothetical protein KC353_g17746 [Hortaea werneckii]RMY49025.1 hypothetical protein D0865_07734 [Hortaea werneckii]